MAHFAQLDENNIVTNVIVVHNNECMDSVFNESEAVGIAYCESLLGGRWIQTSYNAKFRKKYAGIGDRYDAQIDAFIPPQPFPSWVFNEETWWWEAPLPIPKDGEPYVWNEGTLSWQKQIFI